MTWRWSAWLGSAALVALVLYYLQLAPYTKVEESFNVQAIHDILYHGRDLASYDHHEFPGAVPRTFVGALVLAALTKTSLLLVPREISKHSVQTLARAILGLLNVAALLRFRTAIARIYGPRRGNAVANWFILFCLGQFHLVFYATRTLPNMLALPLVVLGYSYVINYEYERALCIVGFAASVFRIELAVLGFALSLCLLLSGKLSAWRIVRAGLAGALVGSALSLAVDSVFWQSFPSLPELKGLIFNVVDGKSAEWGVEPWENYFVVHLPSLLAGPLCPLLGVLGIFVTPRNLQILGWSAALYVFVYSFLPHKELRFIIYVAPVWTALAARGTDYIFYRQWKRSLIAKIVVGSTFLTSLAAIAVSLVKAYVSAANYPGGHALQAFNNIASTIPEHIKVHMDVATCMTGASRFGQTLDNVTYDKTEDLSRLEKELSDTDYCICDKDSAETLAIDYGKIWVLVTEVPAFERLDWRPTKLLLQHLWHAKEKALPEILAISWPLENLKQTLRAHWQDTVVSKDTIFIYKKQDVV